MNVDPIADMLTRVRNASRAKHKKVDMPASRLKVAITDIWRKSGFIRDYKLYRQHEKAVLRIYLKYEGKGNPVIQGLQMVSRGSCRVYVNCRRLPKVLGGIGVGIISTSKGVMSDQAARESRIGGEFLCTVW